ncbi:RHS repeat-associated core domain-containing protein, partial [Nocardia sp. alder85J]|uniref:RHS repeat-associated core domain-containing protein n=1 Tax=Nocardia sp. alder85J TaxID=2862949 RepID=UPI00238D487A
TSGTRDTVTHTLTFTYTPTGQVATQQLDDQAPTRHEYDPTGHRTRRTTPTGSITTWHHDLTGHVTTMTTDGHHIDFTHNPLGRTTSWRIGEIAIHRTFTDAGHLATQEVTAFPTQTLTLDHNPKRPAPHQLRRDDYTYRPDGYRTTHTLSRPGTEAIHREYDLDLSGRVTSIFANGILSEAYNYDPLNNITTALRRSLTADMASADSDSTDHREYHNNILVRAGRTRYFYDPAGRLIRRATARYSRNSDVWQYRYNAFDQLTDVYTPDRQHWHYTYDALGRRTTKQRLDVGSTALDHVEYGWDATQLAEQWVGDQTTRWHYLPGTRRPIVEVSSRPAAATQLSVIITDPAGSPTELLDPTDGVTRLTADVQLWGQTAWSAAVGTILRFPGQIYDHETGFHYNLHRYYDPDSGRYLTLDPLGLTPSVNPSAYPRNPTAWADPLGLIPDECEFRDFAHGTSRAYADNIVDNGLSADAGRDATHGGRMSRPGSFFTHEVDGPDSPGIQSAYEWGLRVDSNSPSTVIIGRIPEQVYQSLLKDGLIQIREVGEGVPLETIFHPDSFEVLNREIEWIAKMTP